MKKAAGAECLNKSRDLSAWVELRAQAEKEQLKRLNEHKIVYLPIQPEMPEMSREEKIFRRIDQFLEQMHFPQVILGVTFLYLLYHIFITFF